MIISAGTVGTKGVGNHKHNDIFSFELCARGEPFIIDPGTYIYTPNPEMRNLFRSTAYHNTAGIDGVEINHFDEDSLFTMTEQAYPETIKWESVPSHDIFAGEHRGYSKLKNPAVHKREILFNKNKRYWLITDNFEGTASHEVAINYFTAAKVTVRKAGFEEQLRERLENIEWTSKDTIDRGSIVKLEGRNCDLYMVPMNTRKLQLSITPTFESKSYGIIENNSLISFQGNVTFPVVLKFFLMIR
jgi:hypothetical protein